MEVKYFLTAYSSKPDFYGNSYHAFTMTDADDHSRSISATISGNNVRFIMLNFDGSGDWDRSIVYTEEQLPIRRFNALTKGWPYLGGVEDIQKYVHENMPKGANNASTETA